MAPPWGQRLASSAWLPNRTRIPRRFPVDCGQNPKRAVRDWALVTGGICGAGGTSVISFTCGYVPGATSFSTHYTSCENSQDPLNFLDRHVVDCYKDPIKVPQFIPWMVAVGMVTFTLP